MILVPIKRQKWHIFAYCRSERSCDLLDWIGKLDDNYRSSLERLFAIIDMVAKGQQGPRLLAHDICHQIDKQNQIYEFIAGALRLLWFYSPSERRVIICTNILLKKSQRTPKKEIQKAIRIKKQYIKEQSRGKIKTMTSLP